MYTTNNIQTSAIYQSDGLKQPKIEGVKSSQNQEFPTFCYANMNHVIQKLAPASQVCNLPLKYMFVDLKSNFK
jgi:hypothetical protein